MAFIIKEKIFKTTASHGPLTIRLMLGLVILPHGAQKLLGWFGGYGFSGTLGFFTDTLGIPWAIGFLIILLESIGALALIVGIGTRLIATSYLFLALGIVFTSHLQNGFFMNWSGAQQGEGVEFFLLWIGMALCLVITGSGKYSVDRHLMVKRAHAQ